MNHPDFAEPPLKQQERPEKIVSTFKKSLRRAVSFARASQRLLFKLTLSNKKFLLNLGFLLILVLAPSISDAISNQQLQSELKQYSQKVDPIKAGEFAENMSKYTPGIKPTKNNVALAMMTKDDSYTLNQQLALNGHQPSDEPARSPSTYTVQKGESITTIAQKFNLHVASILEANSLNPTDLNKIQPGSVINIPTSDTSTSTDWLATIQQQADDQKKAEAAAAAAKKASSQRIASAKKTSPASSIQAGTIINGVRYIRPAQSNEMQCYTYVVSQGYPVGGHMLARWIPTNSSTPKVGGLVVTRESWAGHVAIVIAVNGDGTFNIRESNYVHGLITERTLSVNNGNIIGYVN